MNPEESQTPESIDEWLEQTQEQNPTLKNPENSSLESVVETQAQTSSVETQLDNANSQLLISNIEVTPGDQLTEEPDAEFVVHSEAETATLGSEDNSLYAQAANRVAELQRTEAAL